MEEEKEKSNIGDWVTKNKVLAFVIFWGLIIGIPLVLSNTRAEKDEYTVGACLMNRMTLSELRELAEKDNLGFIPSQADLDKINEQPLCRDMCLQQQEYARNYTDWFADDDVRKICSDIGLALPQ